MGGAARRQDSLSNCSSRAKGSLDVRSPSLACLSKLCARSVDYLEAFGFSVEDFSGLPGCRPFSLPAGGTLLDFKPSTSGLEGN